MKGEGGEREGRGRGEGGEREGRGRGEGGGKVRSRGYFVPSSCLILGNRPCIELTPLFYHSINFYQNGEIPTSY